MNEPIIQDFDFLTLSLRGRSLIEASAGTGKTYLIVMLYLRLLLGIGNEDCLQSLTVENILVVTFTKVAVEELRERIRIHLREFRLACIVGYSTNIFFSALLEKIDNTHLACQTLLAAERTIDRASIFTIHGFCQHILNVYPIELNSMFQYTILEYEGNLVETACNDFWRNYFYSLPTDIVNIITGYWKNPKDLLKDIYPYLYHFNINIRPVLYGNFITRHKYIIAYINHVKKTWITEENQLLKFVSNKNFLSRRIYNTHNILNWFKIINLWAQNVTVDYQIPDALYRFKYSVIMRHTTDYNHQISQYQVFTLIDTLFEKIVSLKQLILSTAIYEIRKNINLLKKKSSEISFNDLISLLDDGLHIHDKNGKLLQSIRINYPIAIFDEFQDTDLQQYRIFHTLYPSRSSSKYGLLLIGDPKQSIYSFRGADIFSYLLARKDIDFYYTLNTNWRASAGMVNAINKLFSSNASFSPFIFQEIPYITMYPAKNNNKLRLVVKNKSYPSLCFYLTSYNSLTINEYQKIMAFHCASIIRDLLRDAYCGQAWLQNSTYDKKLLQSSDIVILVRNGREGRLMSSVLHQLNISNIYLSNQKNIFGTLEAFDVLCILQAVLFPEDKNILRCALITRIIGYNAQKIEFINQNENAWKQEVNAFIDYQLLWKKYGIQSMLQEIIFRRHISQRLLTTQDGKNSLINILHLAEILQKYSMNLHDESSLVNCLKTKINSSDNLSSDDQLLRLIDDVQSVKIITIHKSKGLEFPLVFLPFISILHKRKYPLFHDRKNYRMYLDLSNFSKNIDLSDKEQLSEDLRLLYVAVTRAIYHCFVGIGSIFFKKKIKKNQCCNDLHRTALGYLVQRGVPGNFNFLEQCLTKLVESAQGDIVLNYISNNHKQENCKLLTNDIPNNSLKNKKNLSARSWKIQVNTKYTVTSYSELYHFNAFFSSEKSLLFNRQIIHTSKNNKKNNVSFTPYSFPQGKESGIFLHYIFQKWNFKKKVNDEWLSLQLMKHGIDLIWLPILQMWMDVIVSMPLNDENFVLSQLLSDDYRTEFEFYLSVSSLVSAEKFDDICKRYDQISRLSLPLTFPDILGMIHGFIDLVFRWKGKYYLLDYKSNWLGCEHHDYSLLNIKNEMVLHHYALQYQIYTLALHRFLRHKLISYSYKKHFGGVYYLFLRGIDLAHPGNGIYFCLPDQKLIDELDKLLSVCE